MKDFYTAGELAKLVHVSYKTIRYYYEKGLIAPEQVTESGYRLYGKNTVVILQRIMMLKYLDFSIEEIKRILNEENPKETFRRQEELLKAQKEHLEQVLTAVEEIQKVQEDEQWERMLDIIQMTSQKEEILKQYKESGNLQKRINIHEYSTSKVNWFDWMLERVRIKSGMKILEIGCGNGCFWTTVCRKLPENLQIFMTDNSEGMLEEARKRIEAYKEIFDAKKIQFIFLKKDAENFHMEEKDFDRIMANHMLYHVSNAKRPMLLQTCAELLKEDGMFLASTIGKTHLQQLFELVSLFDKRIEAPGWMSKEFELENGGEQLEQIFASVFAEEQENDLLVPDAQVVYDYLLSLPGNAKELVKGREKEFRKFLEGKISKERPFFIHKSTGMFWAFKQEGTE